MEIIGFVESP